MKRRCYHSHTPHTALHGSGGKTAVQTIEEGFAYERNPKKLGPCLPTYAIRCRLAWISSDKKPISGGNRPVCGAQAPVLSDPAGVSSWKGYARGGKQDRLWNGHALDKKQIQIFRFYTHWQRTHSLQLHSPELFPEVSQFHRLSFAVQQLSGRVCIEYELSVIQNPKLHSKGCFLHYGQWTREKLPTAQQRVWLAIVAALEKSPSTSRCSCGSWRSPAFK